MSARMSAIGVQSGLVLSWVTHPKNSRLRFNRRGQREKCFANLDYVKAALQNFDRAGLLGLLQDLYAGNKDNQAFLHARLSLGRDQLKPYKTAISSWICPDPIRNEPVSVSKAKKAIADYKKAIGQPEGLIELSIFYCEEAFSFLESFRMEDESYFLALIRMYNQALKLVSNLPPDVRTGYVARLDKLRSRGRHVGWGVEDELNSLWYATELSEPQE